MSRYRITIEVDLNAKHDGQAEERVNKALICLENSLRYADPFATVVGARTEEAHHE